MELDKYIIELLKITGKMKITEEEQTRLKAMLRDSAFASNKEVILKTICKHKLQYLFLKHLIEIHCIYWKELRDISMTLSERLAFLQIKYGEYLEDCAIIAADLKKENIRYAILKGLSISHLLYVENGTLYRNFNDADFLIAKKNIIQVREILNKANYCQGYVDESYNIVRASRKDLLFWSLNSHQEHKFIKPSKFFTFSPRHILKIDINTTIFEGGMVPIQIPTEELLLNIQSHKISTGFEFYSLNPTYEFIQLCYHFYKDSFQYKEKTVRQDGLIAMKMCDIHEYFIYNYEKIDWDVFFRTIYEANVYDKIAWVIKIVSDFYREEEMHRILNHFCKNVGLPECPNWSIILL